MGLNLQPDGLTAGRRQPDKITRLGLTAASQTRSIILSMIDSLRKKNKGLVCVLQEKQVYKFKFDLF